MNRTSIVAIALACAWIAPAAWGPAAYGAAQADKAMAQPVEEFSFQGSIQQAVERIGRQADVRMVVDWNTLVDAGIRLDARVVLEAKKVTPGQLLDAALAQVAAKGKPLTWAASGENVLVTSQRDLLAGRGVRRPAQATAARGQPSTAPAAAVPRASPVRELNFENTPLGDVLAFFREAAGVNMHVNWRALQAVNVDRSTPVSLRVKDVSVSRGMDLVFDQLNSGKNKHDSVYWIVDGGVVMVSTGTALDSEMRVKVLDVADLLTVVPNFKGPTLPMTNTQGSNNTNDQNNIWGDDTNDTNDDDEEEETIAETRQKLRDSLLAIVKDAIGKEMWEPEGKGSIRLLGGKLVVSQSLLGFKLFEKAAGR